MKKVLALALALATICSLVACGGKENNPPVSTGNIQNDTVITDTDVKIDQKPVDIIGGNEETSNSSDNKNNEDTVEVGEPDITPVETPEPNETPVEIIKPIETDKPEDKPVVTNTNYNTSSENGTQFLMKQGEYYYFTHQLSDDDSDTFAVLESKLDGNARIIIDDKSVEEKLSKITCNNCGDTLGSWEFFGSDFVLGEWLYFTVEDFSDYHTVRVNINTGDIENILCRNSRFSNDPENTQLFAKDNKLYYVTSRPIKGDRIFVGEDSYINVYDSDLMYVDLNTKKTAKVCDIDGQLFQVELDDAECIWNNGSVWFYGYTEYDLDNIRTVRKLFQFTPNNELKTYDFEFINQCVDGDELYLELLGFDPDGDAIVVADPTSYGPNCAWKIPTDELGIFGTLEAKVDTENYTLTVPELDKYVFSNDRWAYSTMAEFGVTYKNMLIYSTGLWDGIYGYDFSKNEFITFMEDNSCFRMPIINNKIIFENTDDDFKYYEMDIDTREIKEATYINNLNFE